MHEHRARALLVTLSRPAFRNGTPDKQSLRIQQGVVAWRPSALLEPNTQPTAAALALHPRACSLFSILGAFSQQRSGHSRNLSCTALAAALICRLEECPFQDARLCIDHSTNKMRRASVSLAVRHSTVEFYALPSVMQTGQRGARSTRHPARVSLCAAALPMYRYQNVSNGAVTLSLPSATIDFGGWKK